MALQIPTPLQKNLGMMLFEGTLFMLPAVPKPACDPTPSNLVCSPSD